MIDTFHVINQQTKLFRRIILVFFFIKSVLNFFILMFLATHLRFSFIKNEYIKIAQQWFKNLQKIFTSG